MNEQKEKAYAKAGVDIALAESLLDDVKPEIKKATRPEVLGSVGGFGGLFDISRTGLKEPTLVSSTDSVGTKVKVASMAKLYKNLGFDIVNHCSNDIAVVGAEPLFFLDYFATSKLEGESYRDLISGVAKACQEGNVALIGGETAELPGVYAKNEFDLVGSIVGVCDKSKLLSGETISDGDVLIGVGSSGLHTNGFSLARKILFEDLGLSTSDPLPGSDMNIGEALLQPHVNYALLLKKAYEQFNKGENSKTREGNNVFGVAHITGGGITGNLPRILPDGIGAEVNTESWEKLPIFDLLADKGNVDYEELHQVFNMGIGLIIVCSKESADDVLNLVTSEGFKGNQIGSIKAGEKAVKLYK